MKKCKTLLLTGVFIFTSVLSCVGFADESTLEGDTLTQGVYSYDVETQTETYEEITFDEESQQAYVSYSSESDVVKTDESYEDDHVQVTGYPRFVGDGLSTEVYGRHMYTHSEKVSGDTSSLVYYQKLDTSGGQSGAPVIETYSDTGDTVIAIHHGTNNRNVNCGVRLSEWLFDYLVDLRHNG